MKKSVYVSVLAAGCSLLFAAGAIAADQKMEKDQQKQGYSQQEQQRQQQQQAGQQEMGQQEQSQYARQLITADRLNGMSVQNKQGEEIGNVDKVVLDDKNGRIAYVVVTSGGFWGIGGEKAVIPWKAVKFQQPQQGKQGQTRATGESVLVVDVSKDQLKNAPQGDIERSLTRQQAEQIHQYYGVAPYWEGQQGEQQQEQMDQQKEQQQNQPMEKQERKE